MTRRSSHVPPLDSPSKQLMLDLIRDLDQVKLFSTELKKVHAFERKTYYESLDQIDREQEAVHTAALDKVAAFHDQVRGEAEAILNEHNRVEEEKRRRKEEQELKERERIQHEKAEELRRQQEEAARLEAERKAQEAAKKKAEEEAERARRAAQEAKERQDREERERAEAEKRQQEADAKKAQEAQEAQQAADEAAAQLTRTQQQQKIGAGRLTAEEVAVQNRYVELHKALKEMRQSLRNAGKQNPLIKKTMGDMRRSIKKCVGQLRDGRGANKKQVGSLSLESLGSDEIISNINTRQLQDIKAELQKASAIPEPSVDIRQFLAYPPPEIAAEENKVPVMLIYALNIFAKCLIAALITEASINHAHAEPIGIVAAQIFSMDEFMYKGIHMSDILWAKYRVVCPALWGFTGSEKTEAGRKALGWWREEAGGPFVSEQTHLDRMTALGAGFSSLTLRNFSKAKRANPFPNTLFWTSIQRITSIPFAEIQDTQITLLHSMLKSSEERILTFFGQYGLVIMRKAIVELPASIPRKSMPVTQLKLLQETYMRHSNVLV